MNRALARALASTLLLVAGVAAAAPARAGGGPETTVVVVNGASPLSRRVANEYVALRRIPSNHVCVLGGVPLAGAIDVETFRTRCLAPLQAFLATNGLLETTDLVAWSVDFPYGVDFEADKPAKDLQIPWTRMASWTAMTYLRRDVEAKRPAGYLAPLSNQYYRRAPEELGPGRELTAEEAQLRNAAQDALIDKQWEAAAKRYEQLLRTLPGDVDPLYNYACCLARLHRLDEALATLERAVAAGYADPAHAADDADLEALRGLDGFKAALDRMAANAKAGVQPPHAFRSRWTWTGGADPAETPAGADDAGKGRYVLSVALGYTGEWAGSTAETLAMLRTSAAADGTNPDGTFYYLVNEDVRATTRLPRFDGAIEALRAMGRKAERLTKGEADQTGIVPVGKDDVLGAMLGWAGFAWKDGKSRIVPGALVEHLTSHGADFAHGGQTKLSELIRNGAAGASGTVFEPYAIPFKFPDPYLHVFYAAGCSMAEAFYQSVAGPYQLLIVGDPLCRPFASFARVAVDAPGAPAKGTFAVVATVEAAAGHPLGALELWVDGRFVVAGKPGDPLPWDTTTVDDGEHDVRVVAVEAGAIGTRSTGQGTIVVANADRKVTITAPSAVAVDAALALTGTAKGAKTVTLTAGGVALASVPVQGDAWKATISASDLGVGPVEVVARAAYAQGPGARAARALVVNPPAPRKHPKPATGTQDGLLCTLVAKDPKAAKGPKPATALAPFVIGGLGGAGQPPVVRQAIEAKGAGPWKEVRLEGEFDVGAAGLYEFVVTAAGELSIDVDGKPALAARKAEAGAPFGVLFAADAGWHALALRYVPIGAPDLTIVLGGDRVTVPIAGTMLRHAPAKAGR